jgi:hypothetical protein
LVLSLSELVEAADPAALLAAVDRLAAARDWDGLVDLARRCMDAVEFGRQLWPVAMHIDYRLAWEAPGAYAAAVLRPGAARFALGPLTEVAASTHDWDALAPHLHDPASAGAVAQERVLRGEDLRGRVSPDDAELPLAPARWEPTYALPRYRDRSAAFPQPDAALRPLPAPRARPAGNTLDEDDAAAALRGAVETWTTESSGSVRVVFVDGDAEAAVGALAPEAALLRIEPAEGLAVLQWAAASGGAYGRRPGGARGRFATWWAAATLTGLPWPPDPDELGAALAELSWHRWSPPGIETGWVLRLAVSDPVDGLAWAIDATDARVDPDGA